MLKRVHFPSSPLPYLLVAPQIIITIIFFMWPASQAMYQSLLIEDAFGLSQEFVWFENFEYLVQDEQYLGAFWRTIFFSICVASLSMGFALLLAGFADRVVRGALAYRTMLIWPYAVAPVLARRFHVICPDLRGYGHSHKPAASSDHHAYTKRAMAGEYSRELSAKVFAGQCRLIEMGFRQGGPAGFGLRRVLVNERGELKGELKPGEHKSLQTDRVILMPGPEEEIAWVNRMFRWLIDEDMSFREIADRLNGKGLIYVERPRRGLYT